MGLLPVLRQIRQLPVQKQQRQPWVRQESRLPRSQTRNAWEDKLTRTFDEYIPFSHNLDLFDTLRNGLPIIEACYTKYKMLIGIPEFDFLGNEQVAEMAQEFIDSVRVNQFDFGLYQWILGLVDSALHYGNGYGELVPDIQLKDIGFLKNAPTKYFRFVKDDDGNLQLGQYDEFGLQVTKFENQEFIYHLAFWKREGHPQGYSLLYPLPFVCQTLFHIENSLKKTWIRMGDPTFAFFIETDKQMSSIADYEASREAITQLETKWKNIQENRFMGKVADITGAPPPGSKVILKTIGEGMVLPDLEISMRTIIEQIVAQTGFPLFFFGFHWGGNYNLTTHQNDMIVNQIDFIRKCIDPIIEKVFKQFFWLKGMVDVEYDWEWPDVNLRDEVEQAKAKLDTANALKVGIEARLAALELGLLQPTSFVEWLIEEGVEDERYLKVISKQKMSDNFRQRYLMAKAMELSWKLAA